MSVNYRNAEGLAECQPCPRDRCGGYLKRSPFAEGLLCSTCKQVWRGR